jgi:uncharacterized Zn finger protein (UPF0148 family)
MKKKFSYTRLSLQFLCLLLPLIYILLCSSCGSSKKLITKSTQSVNKTEYVKVDSTHFIGSDSVSKESSVLSDQSKVDSVYNTKTVTVEEITIVNDTTKKIKRVITKTEKGKKATVYNVVNKKVDSSGVSKTIYEIKKVDIKKDSTSLNVSTSKSVSRKSGYGKLFFALLLLIGLFFIGRYLYKRYIK